MRTYAVRIVGNDGFDRVSRVDAESIEQVVESLPELLKWHGQTTIERFVRIEIDQTEPLESWL